MASHTLTAAADLEIVSQQARSYVRNSKATNTLRAYRSDWRHFATWCARRDLPSLPADPETVALYLTDLATKVKTSTLQRRISGIAAAHRASALEPPTRHPVVTAVWRGIRRTEGIAQQSVAPLLAGHLRTIVDALPANVRGTRDRAALLLGFAGAFRRSELVAIDVEDLEWRTEGLVVTIRRSKTDQDGAGRPVGIPFGTRAATCPVRAVRAWTDAAGVTEGALLRSVDRHGSVSAKRLSDRAVALIVKRAAAGAGFDAALYSGHSLRAGLATSAAAGGATERSIMDQTGHRSVVTVRRYIRDGSLFRDNAATAAEL